MKLPQHRLQLVINPNLNRLTESVAVVTRAGTRSASPTFRAPALPTPHQLNGELPFTEYFRPRATRDAAPL